MAIRGELVLPARKAYSKRVVRALVLYRRLLDARGPKARALARRLNTRLQVLSRLELSAYYDAAIEARRLATPDESGEEVH